MSTEQATGAMSDARQVVDLRSDTVTLPTPAMRRAMAEAEVGNDVYGEDPTLNRLQARSAEMFEREAALFIPSGSMGNLIAIKVWSKPGTEIICEHRAHIHEYELASVSAVAGCMPRTVEVPGGILKWMDIEPLIRPKTYYFAQTSLICLENTSNMHGGTIYPPEVTEDICARGHAAGLHVHLDGARIFNAAVVLRKTVAELSRGFDSVMFCLSKSLGAPMGSMLVGSRDFIQRARVERKLLGGGMTQAGIAAAAGLVAIEESPKRLYIDHDNARALAKGLARLDGITLDPASVVTNIVVFDVEQTGRTGSAVCAALHPRGVLASPTGKYTIRMVTHCDVNRMDIDHAVAEVARVLAGEAKAFA
jgi:threonine aldolase